MDCIIWNMTRMQS